MINDENTVTLYMGRCNKMEYFSGTQDLNKDRESIEFSILFYGNVQEQPIELSVIENLPQVLK